MAWRSHGKTNSELEILVNGIIRSDSVENAMLAVDRGNFSKNNPYMDAPQCIGFGVTISAPHMHAHALELLKDRLESGTRALDVGSGSGYLTACMSVILGQKGASTLNPTQQLLLALRFYASGSMLIIVGDFVGVHKTTVCRIIRQVTQAICTLKDDYISLPEAGEILQVQQGFYSIAGFPRYLLALDGTHVRIQSPGGDIAEQFRNRKGSFFLNVMVACDHKMKFRNIVARWPGASNDINVFDNSYLKARFEYGMGNCLIIGDSGYPVAKYLMTSLQQTTTRAEELYNESLIRTRNKVECAIGIWKRRFPICALGMRVKIETVQDIIVATAILHNISRDMNEAELEVNEDVENAINEVVPDIRDEHNYNNNWCRTYLINHYFAGLV